jgi:hypothetical protein
MKSHWIFLGAAGVPCVVLLVFFGTAVYEWWLISSGQIAVIPRPMRGQSSVPEMPAASLLPLILGSAMLAALFAFAWLRRSKAALATGYLIALLLIAAPLVRRMF